MFGPKSIYLVTIYVYILCVVSCVSNCAYDKAKIRPQKHSRQKFLFQYICVGERK